MTGRANTFVLEFDCPCCSEALDVTVRTTVDPTIRRMEDSVNAEVRDAE